ncbi:MAG TPA: serine hydroxymethyltransferase [Geobacterales bacterium]|nr:serine hydroxymethyltransferase [Geobacterales bacterium]
MSFNEIYEALNLIKQHNKWRRKECINLIASENVTSPLVDSVYLSDAMHRYAEGTPFKRFYQGTRYIDEIEEKTNQVLGELLGAKYVDIRPISGTTANGAAFFALATHGDKAMVLPVFAGSHVSHTRFGILGALGLSEEEMPFNSEEMNIDVDNAIKKIRQIKPKLVILGGTVILFRHPIKELREVTEEVGGYILYDAAHVLGLIAGKQFQDPANEGAHIVTSSTHKTFPGPQGGLAFTNNEEIYKKYKKVIFPVFVSNHHLHRLAATLITAYEMKYFGKEYASTIVKNAKTLAEELHSYGFKVLGEKRGFTETHQVVLNVREFGGGTRVAEHLEKCNIITNKNMIPGDTPEMVRDPSGLRLGVQEMTRMGMNTSEMKYIAELFYSALIKKEPIEDVRSKVVEFRKNFHEVKYTFNIDLNKFSEEYLPIIS